jgi:hypothetical protein
MQRNHRALQPRQVAARPVKRWVNGVERLSLKPRHVTQEHSPDQPAPNAQASADADFSQPGGPALLLPDGLPRPPRQFHRVLHRILRFLHVSKNGQRQAEKRAGIPPKASLEGWLVRRYPGMAMLL